jgi:competence ComEA-like helix-hairpin-helix protein
MAKVPLRVYSREIEDAIEENQIEEAIAHCHHIIKTFPKHIETYRLLGKAYHESQRYGNAADIFQRILSSIPNDFISHLGMSIIREDEGNLDAALWHMERAFETQPYNSAIQGELRRLFGKRDGMEPPKIRLTRGALARMYAKGNLFDQAIAELRATLAEDPQRADLQVMLAEMYAKSGQTTESLDICSSLVQRFPYCLEANRIMAELLPEAERGADIKLCRQRLQELDPYEAFVTQKIPTAEDVSDQAVLIPRLDWEGVPVVAENNDEPEWAATAGVRLRDSDDQTEEELPEWLAAAPNTDFSFDRDNQDKVEGGQSEENIPGWMEAAGWGSSAGESDESAASFVFDEEENDNSESGAVEANVPGWLQNIAPEGSELSDGNIGQPITAASLDEDIPDWLSSEINQPSDNFEATQPDQDQNQSEDHTPGLATETEDDVPEWLQGLGAGSVASGAVAAIADMGSNNIEDVQDESPDFLRDPSSPVDAAELAETESAEVPDWLKDMSEESTSKNEQSSPEDIPDWLQELGDVADGESQPDSKALLPEDDGAVPGSIPDWLQELSPDGAPEPAQQSPAFSEPIASEAAEADDLPNWLQDLGSDDSQGEQQIPASSESGISSPEIKPSGSPIEDDIPAWLQGVEEDSSEESQPTSQVFSETNEPTPEFLESSEDDIPDWLQGIAETEPESPVEDSPVQSLPDESTLILGSEDVAGDIPGWLQGLGNDSAQPETQPEPEEFLEESAAEEADIPAWLQELGDDALAEEPAQEPLVAAVTEEPAAAVEADIPDWLQELSDDAPAEGLEPDVPAVAVTEEPAAAVEADIPDWLQELGDEVPAEELAPEAPAVEVMEEPAVAVEADIPAWLQELGDEVPAEELAPEAPAVEVTEEPAAAVEADIPAWLQELSDDAPAEELEPEARAVAVTEEPAAAVEADIPAWLQELGDEVPAEEPEADVPAVAVTEEPAAAVEADIPAWLQELGDEVPAEDLAPTPPAASFSEEAAAVETDLPAWIDEEADGATETIIGWLGDKEKVEIAAAKNQVVDGADDQSLVRETDLIPQISDEQEPQPETEAASPDFDDADAAMAWLEGLAAKQGVAENELLTSPEERGEQPPDWVQEIETKPEVVAPSLTEDVVEPEDVISEQPVSDIPEWLAVSTPETETPLATKPETESSAETDIDIPEWVAIPAEPTPSETAEPVSPEPVMLEEDAVSTEISTSDEVAETLQIEDAPPEISLDDADAAMAWLEGLAAKQGVVEDELLTSPEERGEQPPDWVQEIETKPEVVTPSLTEDVVEPEDVISEQPVSDIPEWLAVSTPETETPLATKPETESSAETDIDIPEWLAIPTEPTLSETAEPVSPEPVMLEEDAVSTEISASDEVAETLQIEEVPPEIGVDDADAAMAWLEGLAAKQGVAEEELLTSPEERSDTPPEWVQETTETVEMVEPEVEVEKPAESEDTLPDWLQEPVEQVELIEIVEDELPIAAVEAEPLPEIEATGEVESTPEPETVDQIPEWLQEPAASLEEPATITTDPTPTQITAEPQPPEEPGEEVPPAEVDLDDADAAMAWLEGLAAKQGVAEEELLTSPEERSDTPPEWVQETEAAPQPEEVTQKDLPDWLQDEPAPEPLAESVDSIVQPEEKTAAEEPVVVSAQQSDLPAWLQDEPVEETPAAEDTPIDQPIEEPTPPEPTVTDPVEPPEPVVATTADLPKFLKVAIEAEAEEAGELIAPAEIEEPTPAAITEPDLPDFLRTPTPSENVEPISPTEPAASEQEAQPASKDLPAWLQDAIAAEDEQPEPETVVSEPEVSAPETAPEPEVIPLVDPVVEPPTWIIEDSVKSEVEPETPIEEASPEPLAEPETAPEPVVEKSPPPESETLPVEETVSAPEPDAVEPAPPAWVTSGEEPQDMDDYAWLPPQKKPAKDVAVLELNEASMAQLERLQPLGFRRAQAIVVYRDENGPFEAIEDLTKVPGIDSVIVAELRSQLTVTAPVVEAEPKPATGTLPPLPTVEPEDEFHAQQLDARDVLSQGQVDEALTQYGKLIKKGKRLDGVIADLDQALTGDVTNEACVEILQTLGDAHMKANRLQDALDAYTKAEELLR